ncbi:MAG: DUF6249 domain-containing protein [Pseudomonadota bacterium]
MDSVEVFIPIVMFIVIGVSLGMFIYFRFRARQELQLTVRAALDSGQTVSSEIVAEITAALHPKKNDLRRGLVFVAIALAFVVFGFAVQVEEAQQILSGLAAFPFFVGVAYLILWRMGPKDEKA